MTDCSASSVKSSGTIFPAPLRLRYSAAFTLSLLLMRSHAPLLFLSLLTSPGSSGCAASPNLFFAGERSQQGGCSVVQLHLSTSSAPNGPNPGASGLGSNTHLWSWQSRPSKGCLCVNPQVKKRSFSVSITTVKFPRGLGAHPHNPLVLLFQVLPSDSSLSLTQACTQTHTHTVAMSIDAVASSMMRMLLFLTKALARQNNCL